jgi:hypothetical protein
MALVKVAEFERRQMAAVKKELGEEYEAAVGLNIQPSKAARPGKNIQQLSALTQGVD